MQNAADFFDMDYDLNKMCMHAIDRSQGQLVDIKIEYFCTNELIEYMAVRYYISFISILLVYILCVLLYI